MPHSKETLNRMAEEIFELYKLVAAARSRLPSGPDDVSESEFITLDLLAKEEPLTIGEVQKRIGVVPAQMSRIVRSLEEQGGKGYVECRINAEDRRRIDLCLTPAGKKVHESFRTVRLGSMHRVLEALCVEDRVHLLRIVGQLRTAFEEASPKS